VGGFCEVNCIFVVAGIYFSAYHHINLFKMNRQRRRRSHTEGEAGGKREDTAEEFGK
jgi:hypothetical protein